jgi:hypothetical protein
MNQWAILGGASVIALAILITQFVGHGDPPIRATDAERQLAVDAYRECLQDFADRTAPAMSPNDPFAKDFIPAKMLAQCSPQHRRAIDILTKGQDPQTKATILETANRLFGPNSRMVNMIMAEALGGNGKGE